MTGGGARAEVGTVRDEFPLFCVNCLLGRSPRARARSNFLPHELERHAEALTDALTGLPNRRDLFEAADALSQDCEWSRPERVDNELDCDSEI
jgi:hypothetical protein